MLYFRSSIQDNRADYGRIAYSNDPVGGNEAVSSSCIQHGGRENLLEVHADEHDIEEGGLKVVLPCRARYSISSKLYSVRIRIV